MWKQLQALLPAAKPEQLTIKGLLRRDEPTFLYRCGTRPAPPPVGYYWRLMSEYPTLRMYQLERKEVDKC